MPAGRAHLVGLGQLAHAPDEPAEHAVGVGGQHGARRPLVDGGELVGEAGHGAADADAAHVHAPAVAVDDASLGDVALHDRAPAPQLDEALLVAVGVGEDALLVVAGPRAMAMDGLGEQPGRPPELIEFGQWRKAVEEQQGSGGRLGDVVAHRGAARDVDHREPQRGSVVLAQVVHDAHGVGGVAVRGRDAAPAGAGSDRQHRGGAGSQPVEPFQAGYLAAVLPVLAESHPVAVLARDGLVHDRPLPEDQVGGVELALGGQAEVLGPFGPGLHRQHGVDELYAGQSRDPAGQQVLDPGVGGAGNGDGAAVAAGAHDPEQVGLLQRTLGDQLGSLGPGRAAQRHRRERVGGVGDERLGLELAVRRAGHDLGVLSHVRSLPSLDLPAGSILTLCANRI